MTNEPFGRQPQPVNVQLHGDTIDVDYWMTVLMRRAEFKGDLVAKITHTMFRIYPRAVND